jgi:ATP-dependent exoDNAse (exonuclease V) beta subunit
VVVEDALLAADRRARAEALDVRRSFIVQAPAGSGKTELLIQRYLRLLAEVDHPEEVVAITFTRKAAQEMQLRAIAAMRDVQSGVMAESAHHRLTQDAARKVLERDHERGWNLLDSPRRMRIQTLDALNAGIARSLPFSSGLGTADTVVTDDELRLVYRSAASATLDWLVTVGAENAAVEQVLSHLDNNTTVYIEYVARMLATRDQWTPLLGSGIGQSSAGIVRRHLERNITREVTARLQRVRRLLPDEHVPLLLSLCRHAGANLLLEEKPACTVLAECEQFPEADARHIGLWRAIAALLLTQSGDWRKTVTTSDGFPPRGSGQKQQMLQMLQLLAEDSALAAELHCVRQLPDPRYTDEQWSVLLALFRLLPLAVAELRRLFSERGIADHTQVAEAAAVALGHPDRPGEIGLLLDFTIRHLLVDEMQDTSLAQYRLLERLVAGWEPGDGRTLFCVGDPMQSIYRFRDAEVGQFLIARERGIGPVALEPLVLRQNFRSGEHLVHRYNTVFGQMLPKRDDVATGAIAYAASVPVAERRGLGDWKVYPLFGATYEEEADFALDVIRRCVSASEEQSTAVLVRSRTQLPLLLARLREARIPYQAVEIDRLTDLPEIIDLLALTRAIAHRADRIAWLGLLRGAWVGIGWMDLHALVFNDTRSTVWELMHDDERLRALSPAARTSIEAFRETMAPFLAGHGTTSLRETVEHAWYRMRGPLLLRSREEVDNVYRFLDVLEVMDTAGTLQDVAELEFKLDHERVSGSAVPDCRLHIMTMHKAKGLQFDHVVLYGLGRTAKADQKSILSWLALPDREDGPSMLISPVGPRAELERDPLHNFIETTDRDKRRLEQDRLLYVACTRARRSVHLVGHVPLTADGSDYRAPPKGALLGSLWPTLSSQFAKAFRSRAATVAKIPSTSAPAGLWSLPELRRLDAAVTLPPPQQLPRPSAREQPLAGAEQQVDFYWVGSVARHAGTILHRWLYRIAVGRMQVDMAHPDRLLAAARQQAGELGVPRQDLDAVCERALHALRRIAEDETGRWILTGPGHAELPLTGIWRGSIESIVIDRVRIDDAGVHWIIDYKASTHEGGGLDIFMRQESERYRQQLAKYAFLYRNLLADPQATVRTALYFPLLQQFCEVMPGDPEG